MPPRLRDYRYADWLRLRPIVQGLKIGRYRIIDRGYRRQAARVGEPSTIAPQITKKRLLVSIAFNDPQAIAWQAALVRHFVRDATYLVADNTAEDRAAREIRARATAAGALYVRLPSNPARSPSRSHGLALNWVWENIVKPGRPDVFGFLDDDIFPTETDDPFAPLSVQDFFGVVRQGVPLGVNPRWFLWAGFCMFRYSAIQDIGLDFSQDWFVGLDTGGGNWSKLYQHVERSSIREQSTTFLPFRDGIDVSDGPIQWCGSWLHAVGLMGKPELATEKAAAIADILKPHLVAAGYLLEN